MDGGFGDLHGPRLAGQKEINVIDVATDVGQVNAGEIAARTQLRQVFGVDPDQLEAELFVPEGKIEIASPQADLLLDMLLDACLDIGGNLIGCGWSRRGGRGRRLGLFFLPAARPYQADYRYR